ncbi:carotenoid 1,2-hydratase [Ideonella azotifigens]|uniref:Lipocalin-like domain-containing protein n=2 Tax=Ideonella azotifigens TaxID=513160 RepID=A0ABP3VQJ7_9BURK|nr:carotenoid 1,2-hydratase [Ideonella azotifigens]MCD2343697.1 carotenoid 1,2-hydratase [Ideonella azotifigens]
MQATRLWNRRQGLLALLAPAWAGAVAAASPDAAVDEVRPDRVLRFPSDHGSHPGARTEWWYLTGHLEAAGTLPAQGKAAAPRWGFQITFFRSRTGLAEQLPGRLAPRQVLFAHAALTDLGQPGQPARHLHDQRMVRWNGEDTGSRARADRGEARLRTADWQLQRDPASERWQAQLPAKGFGLDLQLAPTQPVMLQGEAGHSRKGPLPGEASHYYSLPQLVVQGELRVGTGLHPVQGRAWMDHEWSNAYLAPEAVGWDWVGFNLDDGSALMLFRMRARDEQAAPVWAGGSWRDPQGGLRTFQPGELRFEPGRRWRSPDSGASYPVQWTLHTPVGRFQVEALLDAQELDSRASTGTVYWEGLSVLRDEQGRRLGLGYLEMTGRAGRLAL